MKMICKEVSTLSFDNHQVLLQNDEAEVRIRFKERKDFDTIRIGDSVEVSIGEKKSGKKSKK